MDTALVYIFTCSDKTYNDCMTKQLFGTNSHSEWVHNIKPGDICLLHNASSRQIQGVWEAVSQGQTDIDKTAWGGDYPYQVRVRQRSELIQTIPKYSITGIATGENDRVYFKLEGEKAQSLLKLFSSDNEQEAAPGIPLVKEEVAYRSENLARFRCNDGHMVRSLSEKTIDDWLASHYIFHAYEPLEYFSEVAEQMIPDFRIHDKTGNPVYIEYWGMEDKPQYSQRMERKKSIYEKHKKSLIELTFQDLATIDKVMHQKLRAFKVPINEGWGK